MDSECGISPNNQDRRIKTRRQEQRENSEAPTTLHSAEIPAPLKLEPSGLPLSKKQEHGRRTAVLSAGVLAVSYQPAHSPRSCEPQTVYAHAAPRRASLMCRARTASL
ncbi:hypothetical protein SKAU_G00310570 [Synaphobranchus kaupii]|uniref:Uncharacterized protein n=1 Tax=Synaphobranchus kaupii TaxID=118154 RepID=A0A9Q1ERS4_SYNKA|nr:hypothetical protein SKAU_G00310570 [Synaphobranchus kaupii]